MPEPAPPAAHADPAILASVVGWLERAVIGLNLCPFAKGVHVKGQVHYRLSQAEDPAELLAELQEELLALAHIDSQVRASTLLSNARRAHCGACNSTVCCRSPTFIRSLSLPATRRTILPTTPTAHPIPSCT